MFKKNNSKGFTLIELLIVIIIIGILAAIAFVAYNGAQQKAKKADAQSTLSSVKTKLGEYDAGTGNYPVDKTAVTTWLSDTTKGNSPELSTTFGADGYVYTAQPAGCDNSTTQCTGFKLTAQAGTLGFGSSPDDDVTMSN